MSGRLFQKDKNPTEHILATDAIKVQSAIINQILDKYPDIEYVCLGSVGKKKSNDYNGDIDIGIKTESIEKLSEIIHEVFDYTDTVDNKTIYIVSVKYPYINFEGKEKYVAVDFILVSNIEYTKFRYYCPDYRIGESKYKVGTKIMFVGTILNHCLNEDRKKLNPGEHLKYQFLPTGLFVDFYKEDTKEFAEAFCTDEPQEIVDLMFNDCGPEVCNTVETLWEALHSDKFKYPEEVKNVELSFFVNSYRKGWEELVNPEDFELQYWTVEEIKEKLKVHSMLRKINNMFI